MTLPITLQDLRYVVALADNAHFGRAATACRIGQSTLSTQIKKLETQLAVTLFERTTQSVSTTAIGAEVARRARQVLADVDAIAGVGQQAAGPLAATFTLGVIPTLGPYLLPWLIPPLKRDYPKLRLTVCEDLTAPLLDRLTLHRLDAALVALPIPGDRLLTRPLFDEPFWFAEPIRHPTAPPTPAPATPAPPTPALPTPPPFGEVMTTDDLQGRRLLLLTEGNCLRDQALAICCPNRETPDPARPGIDPPGLEDFRATSLETILQMVATGLGSTLLPALACTGPHTRALATRPLEPGVGRRIGLAWRASHPRPGDISRLAETLHAHLPPGVHPV